ncbi:MAG: T9SS type A sorting domain-containing protein, partial [Candidatus Woesearchaeota archaeon]
EVFFVVLPLLFYGPDGAIFESSVINDKKEQIHTFQVPFIPDSIKIDTRKLLCELRSTITSVKEVKSEDYLQNALVFPNPLRIGQEGRFALKISNEGNFDISIYNILGNRISNIYSGTLSSGLFEFSFSTSSLAQGSYFINIKSVGPNYLLKFEVIK